MIVLLTITVIGLLLWWQNNQQLSIPKEFTEEVSAPLYLPTYLPGTYKIDKSSFNVDEQTFIFKATDGAGSSIAFTEQKKPEDFDFTNFYNEQLRDMKTLDNVPFPSVIGKAQAGKVTFLSIVTDQTWIVVTTMAPLGEDSLQKIASGMQQS